MPRPHFRHRVTHTHTHTHLSAPHSDRLIDSPSDLVAELLAWDDGDLLAHPLVGVEVVSQPGVVFLNDDPGGLLHRLGPDSSLQTRNKTHMKGNSLICKSCSSTPHEGVSINNYAWRP